MTTHYASEPLVRLIEYGKEAMRFFGVSMRSIEAAQVAPRLMNVLSSVRKKLEPGWDDSELKRFLEETKEDAEFAAEQCAQGFPLLQEFTLVGFWGALEATVEDVVIAVISHEPMFLRAEPFAKVKISISEYETLDKDDRMRILLRELQRFLRTEQRHGVNSFEAILDAVRLSGEVSADVREALWQMHHIRNLIVHRGSRVDRTFADACPNFGLKVGERMKVTRQQCSHYVASLLEYSILIGERIEARYGCEEVTAGS